MIASLAGPARAQTVDTLEGVVVREIRVTGVKTLPAGFVERHLSTQVGQPFHVSSLQVDRRRLDELRLFTSVSLKPRLDSGAVILEVVQEPEDAIERGGGPERPAFFWGLAFVAPDLEATVASLGDRAGEIRAAVQPGRQIATLLRAAGLALPIALISGPHEA